jgi:hypothetical protein
MTRANSQMSDDFRVAYYKSITDVNQRLQMLAEATTALANASPPELLLRKNQLEGMKMAWGL